jgi:DNA topoisomerase IB
MARKTKKENTHEFTKNIHSTKRTNTRFANMENHNEKQAKAEKKVCCHDCRFFNGGCDTYVGMYHKPCGEFEWW